MQTAITVYTLFVLLARYPEVQAKAKAEVDNVVGRERMPEVKDTSVTQMPYLDALVKELLRFHPAVPMSIPHATMEDDMHDGYFIPKGATVLPNLW
jgi:cytochrome P450